jgi:stage V sporulation protein B
MIKQNLAKSAVWVTLSEILFNLSGFIIHSVLGRFLGPADYGRYGIIITLTTMIIILIGNGIPTAMAKYISEYFEHNSPMVRAIKRQAVILQTIIIGSITVIFFFSIPLICKFLGDPTLMPLFRISTLIIPAFAAASFYFSYYTGLHRFNLQATLKTLRSIFRIVFVIGLAYFWKVEGSIVGYIVAPGLIFLIAYLIDKFKVSRELALANNNSHSEIAASSQSLGTPRNDSIYFDWHKLVNYAWQIVVFFLAYELLISIDLYLVKGILRDDHLTGIYNGALTVGRIPYYIFYAMTIFLLPMISKSTSENNREKTAQILNHSLRLLLILLVPMIILMSAFAKPILIDFYGAPYAQGALAMSILEYGVGFLTIFYVMSFAMNGAGKTKITMLIASAGFILNTILNYFLIKKYGITGSAIATTLTSFIIMLWMLFYLHRDFGVSLKLGSLFKVFLSGAIIYFAAGFLSQGNIIFIFWSIILFALYLAILYLLGEIIKNDWDYVSSLVKRKPSEEIEPTLENN